jgi:lysozyme family protein
LPPALAFFHFDAAVNQGVTGAARMLQQSVGTDIDGEIGPLTLAAVAGQSVARTLSLYADVRRQRYRSLSHFWRFGKGWLARVDRTLARAQAIDRAQPSTPTTNLPTSTTPSQQQEKTSMATQSEQSETATPAQGEAKWWGHSMTIWGVIVTSLSTVLPTIGPLLGLNITADLVHQIGDQLVQTVQALGGLVGTVLTVYGRMRATTLLERRQITLNM